MWMTPDGVTHSNAHAVPALVVTDRLWQSLVLIAELEGESSALAIDVGFDDLLEDLSDGRLDLSGLTPGLEEEWMPDEYLDGEFTTSAEVRAYLDTVSIDWRLEAYESISDILTDLTPASAWRRLRRAVSLSLLVGVALGLWLACVTVRWLISSHPWVAIYPGTLAAFFLWLEYSRWRFGPFGTRPQGWALEFFGAAAAVGIAVLWTIADSTHDHVYHKQAVGFSYWGGMLVLGGLVVGVMWLFPKTRARMRALKRGELDEYKQSRGELT